MPARTPRGRSGAGGAGGLRSESVSPSSRSRAQDPNLRLPWAAGSPATPLSHHRRPRTQPQGCPRSPGLTEPRQNCQTYPKNLPACSMARQRQLVALAGPPKSAGLARPGQAGGPAVRRLPKKRENPSKQRRRSGIQCVELCPRWLAGQADQADGPACPPVPGKGSSAPIQRFGISQTMVPCQMALSGITHIICDCACASCRGRRVSSKGRTWLAVRRVSRGR